VQDFHRLKKSDAFHWNFYIIIKMHQCRLLSDFIFVIHTFFGKGKGCMTKLYNENKKTKMCTDLLILVSQKLSPLCMYKILHFLE